MTHTILDVSGLTSRAPDGTTLLDDVSFAVEAGWLVAVVGPTGAGKSSLAKALLGQLPTDAGTVTVTGPHSEAGGRRGRVAGVPQEDATHPQLTLRRTLEHAAALRVGTSVSQRRATVDRVLSELGLTSRAGTRLADLSGGERKRANVAVELVGQPDLLVLDEPTAGLDPGFEKSVFANLRTMADKGRTIIAITHSMRVLAVCDRVLFLAPGGTVAFFGTPSEAEAYFDWDDPADAYAALATTPASAWKSRLAAHQARRATPVRAAAWSAAPSRPSGYTWTRPVAAAGQHPTSHHVDSWHIESSGHLGTLLRRALHVASSDRRALLLSLAAGPLVGLLLWAVLPKGTLAPPTPAEGESMASAPKAMTFAFFLAMTITWLAAASAAREVVKERHILRREVGVGVSLSTYLAGKAVFLSGFAVLQVIPLAAITLISQNLPGAGPALGSGFVEVLVVSVLVGVAAVTTGLLVSAWASSSEKAMTVLPVVLVAQLALAGPWAADGGPVIGAVRQLIPTKWAASAIAASVTGDGSGWWTAAGAIAALAALQLGVALVLLHRSSPSAASSRDRFGAVSAVGSRMSSGPAIRFLPAGVAVVLALAAGAGAMTRSPGETLDAPEVALPASPTTAAPDPPPAPAPAPAPAAKPAAAAPAPTVPPPTTAPVRSTAARPPATVAPRTVAPAPVTAPPTTRPAPTPTTVRPPAPTPTTAPPAVVAPTDPFAFSNWLLQQIFQPVRR